jgi:SAM-dependent methyltransferase
MRPKLAGEIRIVRDTDQDWQLIGERNPYWGVLTADKFKRAKLDSTSIEEFFASGDADVSYIVESIRRFIQPDFAPRSAIDFGCGCGRLTLPMARLVSNGAVGVDVSHGMLAEARSHAEARRVGNVTLQKTIPEGPVDWVNSQIVFQHIPPERGYELLTALLKALGPRGVASIHITAFRDPKLEPKRPKPLTLRRRLSRFLRRRKENAAGTTSMENAAGTISMYDYDFSQVLACFTAHGLNPFWIEHTDHGGHHGFRILSAKS